MDSLIRAASEFLAAVLGLLGFVGRTRRRVGIRQDLELLTAVREAPDLGPESYAAMMLQNHITFEVAKLTGTPLKQRRQIQWGALIVAALLAAGTGYWAVWLKDGGSWTWWAPAAFCVVLLFGALGTLLPCAQPDDPEPDTTQQPASGVGQG
jgi:hypothetical protein